MRKKWKRSKNRIFLGIFAFVCTFTQFASTVEAVPISTIGYSYDKPSFYSDYYQVYGIYDGDFDGIEQNVMPYGVATLRIPLDLFRYENANCNSDSDYIWFRCQGLYLYTEFLTDNGSWTIKPLSVNVVGNNQSFPINVNTTDWPFAVFDMSNLKSLIGNIGMTQYQFHDSFFVDVTFSYQCDSGYEADGSYFTFPECKFRFRLYTNTMEFYKVYVGDDLYKQLFNDDGSLDSFEQNSSSQSSQLGHLNQENQLDKIDINNASTTVDSNIDLNAVGSSGIVLSSLTGHQKILAMLLGVTAISLVAYVFFGKR